MNNKNRKTHSKIWRFLVTSTLICSVSLPAFAENLALPSAKSNSQKSSASTLQSLPSAKLEADSADGVLDTGYVFSSGWCQPFINLGTLESDVTINGFEAYMQGTLNRDVNVYWKVGPHNGSETTPGDWDLLGTVNVTPGGNGTITAIPVGGVTIPAGQTYGFYFWDGVTGDSDGPGFDMRIGGTEASNGDLMLSSNTYTCNEVFSSTSSGFGWQGTVMYSAGVNDSIPVPAMGAWGLLVLIGLLGLVGFQTRKRFMA